MTWVLGCVAVVAFVGWPLMLHIGAAGWVIEAVWGPLALALLAMLLHPHTMTRKPGRTRR